MAKYYECSVDYTNEIEVDDKNKDEVEIEVKTESKTNKVVESLEEKYFIDGLNSVPGLTSANSRSEPLTCPVCSGRGIVPFGFYNYIESFATTNNTNKTCRSCWGAGVLG